MATVYTGLLVLHGLRPWSEQIEGLPQGCSLASVLRSDYNCSYALIQHPKGVQTIHYIQSQSRTWAGPWVLGPECGRTGLKSRTVEEVEEINRRQSDSLYKQELRKEGKRYG